MDFPQDVIDVAATAARKFPDDVNAAVDAAMKNLKRRDDFDELSDLLLRQAVQDMVYGCRHRENVKIRRESSQYGQPAKVVVGSSSAVQSAAQSVYSYFIAGTVLGAIKGADLASIAESEERRAAGHSFNASLCRRLSAIVPADKSVREAVSEKRLRSMFVELKKTQAA